VGEDYKDIGEFVRSSEYLTKAFQLREHASEREKLFITGIYYRQVTGELDKAAQTFEEEIESYPREFGARVALGGVFARQGKWEKAAEITRQTSRLAPDSNIPYGWLAIDTLALQRPDEARQIIHDAQARNMDSFGFHRVSYALAFLRADSTAMAEQQQWFSDKGNQDWCSHPIPKHMAVIWARRGN